MYKGRTININTTLFLFIHLLYCTVLQTCMSSQLDIYIRNVEEYLVQDKNRLLEITTF